MEDTKSLELALGGVNAGRRDFLKKLLVTAAVAVPVLTTTMAGDAQALKVERIIKNTHKVSDPQTATDIKLDSNPVATDIKIDSHPTATDIKIDPNLNPKARP